MKRFFQFKRGGVIDQESLTHFHRDPEGIHLTMRLCFLPLEELFFLTFLCPPGSHGFGGGCFIRASFSFEG